MHRCAPTGNRRPRRLLSVTKAVALKSWLPILGGMAMQPCQHSIFTKGFCPAGGGAGRNQSLSTGTGALGGVERPTSGASLAAAPAARAAKGCSLGPWAGCLGRWEAGCLRSTPAARAGGCSSPAGAPAGPPARPSCWGSVLHVDASSPVRPPAVAAVAPDLALRPDDSCAPALPAVARGEAVPLRSPHGPPKPSWVAAAVRAMPCGFRRGSCGCGSGLLGGSAHARAWACLACWSLAGATSSEISLPVQFGTAACSK